MGSAGIVWLWYVLIDKMSYMVSAGIVWLLECVNFLIVLGGKCLYCVALGVCYLINCLIWEMLVLCGFGMC